MVAPDPSLDRRPLLFSIGAAAGLGALGIVWGIASGSQMILLDGAYALIGIVLSVVLLRASAMSGRRPSDRYPFGLQAAVPLAVAAQGFVLLATLLYALYEAVLSLRTGGSDVAAGWAILYGIIVTVACVGFTAWIARSSGTSDVLAAETASWKVAAWSGLGMVFGFGAMAFLQGSTWSSAAAYVDPAMVVVSFVLLVPVPLKMLRATAVELLEGTPGEEVSAPIVSLVAELVDEVDGGDHSVSMTKIGPKVYVDVVADAPGAITIRREAELRNELQRRLDELPYEIRLTLALTPVD